MREAENLEEVARMPDQSQPKEVRNRIGKDHDGCPFQVGTSEALEVRRCAVLSRPALLGDSPTHVFEQILVIGCDRGSVNPAKALVGCLGPFFLQEPEFRCSIS